MKKSIVPKLSKTDKMLVESALALESNPNDCTRTDFAKASAASGLDVRNARRGKHPTLYQTLPKRLKDKITKVASKAWPHICTTTRAAVEAGVNIGIECAFAEFAPLQGVTGLLGRNMTINATKAAAKCLVFSPVDRLGIQGTAKEFLRHFWNTAAGRRIIYALARGAGLKTMERLPPHAMAVWNSFIKAYKTSHASASKRSNSPNKRSNVPVPKKKMFQNVGAQHPWNL
jgi:hypothetical protein